MNSAELLAAARRAVEAAGDHGAVAAEAWAQQQHETEIRVFDRAVESLSEADGRGIGIRAFAEGGRSGHAFGTSLDPDDLAAVAARAVELAEASDPDEFAGLPEVTGRGEVEGLVAEDFDQWDTAAKLELAVAVDAAARDHDQRISQVEQSMYADERTIVAIANSDGLAEPAGSTGAWAWSSAFAGTGEDLMTGMGLGVGRSPSALDAAAIGREAAERAVVMIGAGRTESRRAPVVLDEFTAASFIGLAAAALSGEAVLRNRSPFAQRQDDVIAAPLLELVDDGLAPDGLASAPFDGEGVACRRTPLIAGGRIENLLYDSRTAREAGRASTGNARRSSYRATPGPGAGNVLVTPGTATLEELFAEAGDGLYVTNVVGLHSGVNPVSGQFSVGASGIEIKQGKLAGPVREATIASDLVTMLQGVQALGAGRRWVPFGGSILTPPLLIAEMTIA